MLPLAGAKQRALLALLLLSANEIVSSDRLIEELWGEQAPESGRTALQVRCRSCGALAAGSELVVTRAPGYVLRLEREQLDLHRFERLVGEADAADPAARGREVARGAGAVARAAARRSVATSRSLSPRSGGLRSFASRRLRSGSTPISRSVATPTWSASSRRSSQSIRYASGCVRS